LLLARSFCAFSRFVQRLCRRGRVRRRLLLNLLRAVANLALFRCFGFQLFRLLLHGGRVFLQFFFFPDQFLHLLLQFAQIGQHAIEFLCFLFRLGELFLQRALGQFETRNGIHLFGRRLFYLRFHVPAVVEQRARLLHPIDGRFEIRGSRRRHVVDVAANQVRVVHHLELFVFRIARVVLPLNLPRDFNNLLLLENGVLGFQNGGAQQIHEVLGQQQRARYGPHLIARLLLIAGRAEELGVFQIIHRTVQRREQTAALGLFQRRLRTFARRVAVAFLREFIELVQHERDFVPQGDLVDLLLVQIALLVFAEMLELFRLSLPRQPDTHAHVRRLPRRQSAQHDRHFVERLLPLIFKQELFELSDDRFLSRVGFADPFLRAVIVVRLLGLLQQGDNLRHFLFAEPRQHGADGAQNLHVFARDFVALELADNRRELIAHPLRRPLNLLLLQFALKQTLASLWRLSVGGQGHREQQRECWREKDLHTIEPRPARHSTRVRHERGLFNRKRANVMREA
jgi:hypothetical protein